MDLLMQLLHSHAGLLTGLFVLMVAAYGLLRVIDAWRASRRRIRLIEDARARSAGSGTSQAAAPLPVDPPSLAAFRAFGQVPQAESADPEARHYRFTRSCTHCGKSESRTRHLVSSGRGNICDECLEVGLASLDRNSHRRQQVIQLRELTFRRENPALEHHERELLIPEIDTLVNRIRRRRRDMPGDVLANARLIRTVGAGSFATVWEARRVSASGADAGMVAVKVFEQDKLPVSLMLWRFHRGLRAMEHFRNLGKMTPRTIVSLIDVDDDMLSFSMPYLSGGDLQNLKKRKLDLDRRLQLFHQIAGGVAFAHANGIIHRDIKPANVVLDGNGDATLTDFDISDLTFARTQSIMAGGLGTPQFAAPEQLTSQTGADAKPSCDIYSLAKLLIFLLTEESPPLGHTDRNSIPEYMKAVIPAAYRKAIHRALQAVPEQRPQSVPEFIDLMRR